MDADIGALFDVLLPKAPPPTESQRQNAAYTAQCIAIAFSKLPQHDQTEIYTALKQIRKADSAYKGLMIESLLFAITGQETHLKKLVVYLEDYEPGLAECVATYMALGALNFNASPDREGAIAKYIQRPVFMHLFEKAIHQTNAINTLVQERYPTSFTRNNRVVILTKQILRPPHAPTVDTLDFATFLKRDYGKKVLIVVTSEHSHSYDGAVAPCYFGNIDKDFLSVNNITYMGENLPLAVLGNGVLSEQSVAQGLATIAAFNPEMIIAVGGTSIFAEQFTDSSFCFIYPTSRGIPITQNCYFHTWDEADEEMASIVANESLEQQYLFAKHPGFEQKKATSTLTRATFDIPEDAFVFVVVGLRLHNDIDDKFIELIESIAQTAKAHFVFAGHYNNFEDHMAEHPGLSERCSFLGLQQDIMAVYNICDAFLNPSRKGGGSGIVYALQAGLPILSLLHGDAGMAAAGFPPLNDYDAIAETAKELMSNDTTYEKYKAIALEEAPKFTGRAALVSKIMGEFEQFAASRSAEPASKTA